MFALHWIFGKTEKQMDQLEMDTDEKRENDETSELVEVPFKPTRACTAETAAKLYRGQTDVKNTLMIMGSSETRAPLMKDAGDSPLYDMGPERGGAVRAYLHIVSCNGDMNVEVPLRMMPYKTAKDPQKCFDVATCNELDSVNNTLENHNRYITSLLSLFLNENGCGTSAGHVTLPPPPDNLAETRVKRLRDIFKDKFGSAVLAVRYLSEHGKVCEKDYQIEKAVDAANEEAFNDYIRKKQEKGRFRFRILGTPPTYWDGNPDHVDEFGRRVKWFAKENHSFISPEVEVVLAHSEIALKL
jgi:hypothetical protein